MLVKKKKRKDSQKIIVDYTISEWTILNLNYSISPKNQNTSESFYELFLSSEHIMYIRGYIIMKLYKTNLKKFIIMNGCGKIPLIRIPSSYLAKKLRKINRIPKVVMLDFIFQESLLKQLFVIVSLLWVVRNYYILGR